ncbi:MAG: hypothetical protein WB766_07890 [Roseiarcus sp.]
MRNDFHIIPDADDERRAGSVLARIYHDIGLAAVAQALRLPLGAFEPEMIESLERGEFYLLRPRHELARAGADA